MTPPPGETWPAGPALNFGKKRYIFSNTCILAVAGVFLRGRVGMDSLSPKDTMSTPY